MVKSCEINKMMAISFQRQFCHPSRRHWCPVRVLCVCVGRLLTMILGFIFLLAGMLQDCDGPRDRKRGSADRGGSGRSSSTLELSSVYFSLAGIGQDCEDDSTRHLAKFDSEPSSPSFRRRPSRPPPTARELLLWVHACFTLPDNQ